MVEVEVYNRHNSIFYQIQKGCFHQRDHHKMKQLMCNANMLVQKLENSRKRKFDAEPILRSHSMFLPPWNATDVKTIEIATNKIPLRAIFFLYFWFYSKFINYEHWLRILCLDTQFQLTIRIVNFNGITLWPLLSMGIIWTGVFYQYYIQLRCLLRDPNPCKLRTRTNRKRIIKSCQTHTTVLSLIQGSRIISMCFLVLCWY